MTKESKKMKTKAFCVGAEKRHFEWLYKDLFLNVFMQFSYEEELTVKQLMETVFPLSSGFSTVLQAKMVAPIKMKILRNKS